jgi:hypothetical protein
LRARGEDGIETGLESLAIRDDRAQKRGSLDASHQDAV